MKKTITYGLIIILVLLICIQGLYHYRGPQEHFLEAQKQAVFINSIRDGYIYAVKQIKYNPLKKQYTIELINSNGEETKSTVVDYSSGELVLID